MFVNHVCAVLDLKWVKNVKPAFHSAYTPRLKHTSTDYSLKKQKILRYSIHTESIILQNRTAYREEITSDPLQQTLYALFSNTVILLVILNCLEM